MIKNSKRIAMVLTVVLLFCSAFSVVSYAAGGVITNVGESWERVYPAPSNTATTPINGQVRLDVFFYGNTHLDVRMKDQNGNVVWSECCAIDKGSDAGGTRLFDCGSNVYTIEAKTHWTGLINLTNKSAVVTATKR